MLFGSELPETPKAPKCWLSSHNRLMVPDQECSHHRGRGSSSMGGLNWIQAQTPPTQGALMLVSPQLQTTHSLATILQFYNVVKQETDPGESPSLAVYSVC